VRRTSVVAGLAVVVGLCVPALPPASASAVGGGVVVATHAGKVRGAVTGHGTRRFLGIPFAQPPVGALRWRPPQAVTPWRGVRPATSFGSRCVQPPSQDATSGLVGAEDCLHLNVYTPAHRPRERLPVMVWVHGGSAVTGSGQDVDPTRLAEAGHVVVVTVNYRLGPFGYLANAALREPGATSGNYGVLDVLAALRWVRRDVAAFGGDPRRVTAFGESAGGVMINHLLTSPKAPGLFHRAIVESGPLTLKLDDLPAAEQKGAAYAVAAGCPGTGDAVAACLRAAPAAQLLTAAAGRGWGSVVDGAVLPQQPLDAMAAGRVMRVPVIQGVNHDEATIGIADRFDRKDGPLTAAIYPWALLYLFGNKAGWVQLEYPLANYTAPGAALSAVTTDGGFSCSSMRDAANLARRNRTYFFEFDDPDAPRRPGDEDVSFPLGSYHTAEIQYVFGAAPGTFTPAQLALSRRIQRYWTTFARFGVPLASGPAWRPFDPAAPSAFRLSPAGAPARPAFAVDHHCAFWTAYASGALG
jgi:para-nitrobenzyl esterase